MSVASEINHPRMQLVRCGGPRDEIMVFVPVDATSDADARRRAREFRAKLRRELDSRGLLRRPAF